MGLEFAWVEMGDTRDDNREGGLWETIMFDQVVEWKRWGRRKQGKVSQKEGSKNKQNGNMWSSDAFENAIGLVDSRRNMVWKNGEKK